LLLIAGITGLRYVGDISGFTADTMTPTSCTTIQNKKSVDF